MTHIARAIVPVALVLSLGLTGCAAATPHQEPAPVETKAAEPTPEATEEAPAAAAGTRENPIPVDTVTEYDAESQWRFSVGATNPNANAEIEQDAFTTPAEGKVFILAPFYVQVKDTGAAEGARPADSLDIQYVTASGNSYDTGGVECYGTDHLYGVGAMYPGAEATAKICASVPIDDVVGGTWKVASWSRPEMFIFLDGVN